MLGALDIARTRIRSVRFAAAAGALADLPGDDPQAPHLLGVCRLGAGQPQAALALFDAALRLNPDDAAARLHRGAALVALGRHAEAVPVLRAAARLLPADPAPCVNLSSALLGLGRPAAAVIAARRACLRAPRRAETHYALGEALLACDNPQAAADAFRQAASLNPRFARAWVSLGVAHYRAGSLSAALGATQRGAAADPTDAVAVSNLAAFLRLFGLGDRAEELLRAYLRARPGAHGARLNLAAGLLSEGEAPAALAVLDDGAPPPDGPEAALWALHRSAASLALGRPAQARAALDAQPDMPPALRPLRLVQEVMLAAQTRPADAPALADAAAAALDAAPGMTGEHRITAHFDLARFWQAARAPERTMRHWIAGHRELRRTQPFSRARTKAFHDALVAAFDAARLRDGPRAANADPAPVFIVGMPRSGTTLTEQIIGAHPQAYAAGERGALGEAWVRLGGGWELPAAAARIAALGAPALDEAAAAYLADLRALSPGAARVVDKMPGNYVFLGLVALMLPGARVILCTRDPRDIGLSIFNHRFYGWHPYAHDLADLGWMIGEQVRLTAHWRAALPNPLMQVALDDWVRDFDGTLRRVLAFLDLPYDAACARFHLQTTKVRTVSRNQVRQPVNARGIGRWRPYADHLAPLIAELAAAGLTDAPGEGPSQ